MIKTVLKVNGMMCGMCEAHMNLSLIHISKYSPYIFLDFLIVMNFYYKFINLQGFL